MTRKKEKTYNIRVFPEKGSNAHIWFIMVVFRRRKSGSVGLGFVCVAFLFGLSYHTQAQPLPLELTRCLWIFLMFLMQRVFSSCITGCCTTGCCSREKPGAFFCPGIVECSLKSWSPHVQTWYQGEKLSRCGYLPIFCWLAGNTMRLGLLLEAVCTQWNWCQNQSLKVHLKSPKEHWGGCPCVPELDRILPLPAHPLPDLRH